MSDSNRVQLAFVREVTRGTTPGTPRMRKARIASESLSYKPDFVQSDELRDDRMNSDPIKVGESIGGGVNFELSYPVPSSFLAEGLASAMQNDWVDTPTRDNDGTADSALTDVASTGSAVTCVTGAAFVVGHLVRHTGFTNVGNNGVFRVTTGGTTSYACAGATFTNEIAPPAAARAKVVGFEGVSGDITATANGLGSTMLNFTTLGLAVGQWIKIGGSAAGEKFATAALNGWARIIAIAATALTLDNKPSGWTTDVGTGKTINVWFGDRIKNGVSDFGLTLERGFLDQQTPTYVAQRGMTVNRLQLTLTNKQKITGSFDFLGMGGGESTTALDASPDAAPDNANYPIMSASADVGRIAENGATVTTPNWVRELSLSLNNNLRAIEAVGEIAPVDIGSGECAVEVTATTYFGSDTLYAKLLAGTATNINSRITKGTQAIVLGLPRLTAMEGTPNAGGKNQDVMLPLKLMASYDSLTAAQVLIDRLEYWE